MTATPTIRFHLDKRCKNCGRKGVVNNTDLCMRCAGDIILRNLKRKAKT